MAIFGAVYQWNGKVFFSQCLCLFFTADQKGSSEEKFNKLKGMYGKLREEHIQLLRTVC